MRILLSTVTILVGLGLTFGNTVNPNISSIPGGGTSGEAQVAHGTINIALANANGFVVLTDSMETVGATNCRTQHKSCLNWTTTPSVQLPDFSRPVRPRSKYQPKPPLSYVNTVDSSQQGPL